MPEYDRPLGDTIRNARILLGMTQAEVAEALDVTNRTISNIENYKSNPTMDVLFPLIRLLMVDPNRIFYPEKNKEDSSRVLLHNMIDSCEDEEVSILISICQSVIHTLRDKVITAGE